MKNFFSENHHSNTHPDVSKKEMNLHELLLSFPNPPLIPCETAVNLLKIESSMCRRNLKRKIVVYNL